jgi:hypothetical protein
MKYVKVNLMEDVSLYNLNINTIVEVQTKWKVQDVF